MAPSSNWTGTRTFNPWDASSTLVGATFNGDTGHRWAQGSV